MSIRQHQLALRPLRRWVIVVCAAVVVVLTSGVLAWLLFEAGSDPGRRLEAIKTGFTVGLAGGGSIVLFLAVRRQWHQEVVAAVTARDADERRLTDLYVKGTEHLGSPLAQVRIAGLYALERLAQENPHQRQVVTDVISAYLRMPFAEGDEDLETQQELHVRRSAGTILTTHLREPEFWGVTLDLSRAVLVDFNARGCVFTGGLNCEKAVFIGTARFTDARFAGVARFVDADFRGTSRFTGVTFEDDVLFGGVRSRDTRWFLGAKLTNHKAVLDIPGFRVEPDGTITPDAPAR
ncbi:pentapeptide repeat-containing protein [Lentzea albidocapillata]|uniref:Pentapeptide repeat-containing protein n=1 Tax=Lentzea albidocapillata TaxID=40571 RepID=A0A1W2CGK8_9PSEU|nr:pentapeptide repeat-containing protein [Lentzea albidocapillata]SMC84319.1 Pentapeptide repeat-containing protein [Lentzea albidocapillata]